MKKRSAIKVTGAVLATGLFFAVLLFILAYLGRISLPFGLQDKIRLMPDIRAVDGSILVKDPNAKVKKESYRVVVDQNPVMHEGSRKCKLNLENVSGNHYSVQVSLRDYEGNSYYISHRLEPGKRIEEVRLNQSLKAGTYEMQLHYQLYDPGTLKERGSMSVNIHLVVKK